MEGFGGSASRGQGTGEAQARNRHPVERCGFLNETPNQIVDQEVHAKGPLGRLRAAAAEMLHLEGGL